MWSNLPWSSPLRHPFSVSGFFGPKSRGMSFLLGRTVPHELILCPSKSSKSLGDEKKLSINSLCPKPSTLRVKCLTVVCVVVMSSPQVHPHGTRVPCFIKQFVNFDAETFSFLWNILPKDNPAPVFYNYLVHCQILGGVIEFSIIQFLGGHSQCLQCPACLVILVCVTVPSSRHLNIMKICATSTVTAKQI